MLMCCVVGCGVHGFVQVQCTGVDVVCILWVGFAEAVDVPLGHGCCVLASGDCDP